MMKSVANMRDIPLNTGWEFLRSDSPEADAPGDGESWEAVVLPHTPRIEAADVRFPWQGLCRYRRAIAADPAWNGKRVALEIGAAMQIADVRVNGEHVLRHPGGYLPFTIDLTRALASRGAAEVLLRLDNRDTAECPPGKPTADLDFAYFGGLYRGARLIVTDPVHVSDPLEAGLEAGGGVFVTCEEVSAERATVRVRTHIANDGESLARRCAVESRLRDPSGAVVASACSEPVMIAAGSGHTILQTLTVEKPRLWHPDHPHLYTLETAVLRDGEAVDAVETRVGIRRIEVGRRLWINGEEVRISGTNRHQEYPFLGYAVPANAQRRDAVRIKEAGFNFVRLAHYPQHPAFLDACDELGLLVQAPIPGWQIFHAENSFVRTSFENIRQLIRRDRNHPCVVFWEPNFNESGGDHADWCRAAYEIAHAEYPGGQCFTFGDEFPEGWSGWDVKHFVREYGDWSFGGNESTSRQPRAAGEAGMLQQAWNFQWTFNRLSRAYSEPGSAYLGCATWLMFDHNRGYYHKPNWCGAMDMFRLPKFVCHFYRSQRDSGGPMVHIASFWTPRESPAKVVVYSNCDEVELLLNGRTVARRRPDDGPDTPYSEGNDTNMATVGQDVDMSGGNPFDGGNARHLEHPPFTFFGVPYEPGELRAVGYRGGRAAATHTVRTPGRPIGLRVTVDTAGTALAADGADAVFIHAAVVDEHGTTIPDAGPPVLFGVRGPARILGGSPACAEAGIASALLQAGLQPGEIVVTAEAPGLGRAETVIVSKGPGDLTPASPTGSASPSPPRGFARGRGVQ